LLLDLVPDSIELSVIANFEKEITRTRPYLDMGSAGLPVLLKYLIEDVGRIDILFDLLSKTTEPGYGYFISRGETTWPEQWHVDTPSRIHTCYTGIASYFIKGLGGIRPDPNYPGYQSFLIKPGVAGDLKYVKTSTESIYGLIESNWERTDDMFHLDVTIPVNSTAIIYIPANSAESVRESGNNIQDIKGVKLLRTEGNCIVLKVDSGKWKFSSKL
jgi:alpha-L-rhamnosidase